MPQCDTQYLFPSEIESHWEAIAERYATDFERGDHEEIKEPLIGNDNDLIGCDEDYWSRQDQNDNYVAWCR